MKVTHRAPPTSPYRWPPPPHPHSIMKTFDLPNDTWGDTDSEEGVVKVIMRGPSAARLPPDAFINILFENNILSENNFEKIRIVIQDNNRKRYVFGNVSYTHRQQFTANYNNEELSFLLIDPRDKRTVVTLLHMPIQTTEKAIRHIFSALDEECVVSDVKVAPGTQMRHDRWQLLLECQNKDKIPDSFILSKMGIEGEDIVVKVFLEGRNRQLHKPRSNQQNQTLESEQPPLAGLPDAARPPSPHKETEHPPRTPVPPPPSPQSTEIDHIETSAPTPTVRPRPTPSPHDDWKRTKRGRYPHEETDYDSLTPKEQSSRNIVKERAKLARERLTADGTTLEEIRAEDERKRRERAANRNEKTMHDYFDRNYRHY